MTNITKNEFIAMQACLNYDTVEDQLEDNFSDAGPTEVMEMLGWNEQQVAGLITSLKAKGLCDVDDRSADDLPHSVTIKDHILFLTHDGIRAVFAEIEKRKVLA